MKEIKTNYYNPGKTTSYRPDKLSLDSPKREENKTNEKANSTHYPHEKKELIISRKGAVALILVCVLGAGIFSFGGNMAANLLLDNNGSPDAKAYSSESGFKIEEATGSKMTVPEISSQVSDSIVEIRTEAAQQDPWLREYVTEGAGSGIIISSDGYIMTNNHVIEDSQTIYVSNGDDNEYEATLVGVDEENDIAILKIAAKGLTPVTFGNSDDTNVGDLAVVIGNPLGELGDTVSAGVVSAKDREITLDSSSMSLMQTDAAVNPGNSGGGMFNQYGQLIGMIVAKSSGTDVEGLGFAIPSNTAAQVADTIIKKGGSIEAKNSSGTAFSGMTYVDLTDRAAADESGVSKLGIYIQSVNTENARKAGFRDGDMVYSMDGQRVYSLTDVEKIITFKKPGDTLDYKIIRDGDTKKISLKLTSK